MGSDKNLVGKTYAPALWDSATVDLQGFAQATQDTHPAYRGDDALLQPMAVVLATASLGVGQIVNDAALIGAPSRLLKLLHGAEDITWTRPLYAGEAFVVRAHLDAIETTAAGETLHVVTDLLEPHARADATFVVRARTALFIRERTRMPLRQKAPAAHLQPASSPVVREHQAVWHIAADQAERYAQASGDKNPIHLDDAVAQKAGLLRRVVHGLCTMSFAARAITEGFAGGEPGRLRRLALRFVRPVYLGEVLTLNAQVLQDRRITFVVHNQAGRVVLEDGQAQVA